MIAKIDCPRYEIGAKGDKRMSRFNLKCVINCISVIEWQMSNVFLKVMLLFTIKFKNCVLLLTLKGFSLLNKSKSYPTK